MKNLQVGHVDNDCVFCFLFFIFKDECYVVNLLVRVL